MIKLYIFQSVQDLLDFEHPRAVHAATPESVEIYKDFVKEDEPPPKRHYKKHKTATAKKAGKRGRSSCGNCGKSGHNAKTCPEPKSSPIERVAQGKPSTAAPLSPDELAGEIHRLQAEGKTSIQIAAKLKTSLMTVNRHWDPDIAADKGQEEEDEEVI